VFESNSTIFFGGSILTIDDNTPEVEALAIRDGRIIALGDRKKVFQLHSARTQMVDLDGRAVMPGFIDAHAHLAWSASIEHRWLDVSARQVPDRSMLLSALKTSAETKKKGEWVLAFGYDPVQEPGSEGPLDVNELNKVSATHPIFVLERSGEAAHVNHHALEVAAITSATTSNGHGYTRDGRGRLTGEVRGAKTLATFFQAFRRAAFEQDVDDCMKVLHRWARQGCTTVYDAAVGALSGQEEVRLLLDLASEPGTPIRLRAALVSTDDLPRIAGIRAWRGNDRLSFVGIKFAADGPQLCPTADLAEVPLSQSTPGQLNHDDEELKIRMQEWHDSSWQLLVRANGFNAVEQSLRTFESILRDSPNPKHRHRLDGCPLIDERQLRWVAEIGLSVSHHTGQLKHSEGLSQETLSRVIPLASEFANNIRVSLHSESPASPVQPLSYLQTAVTRQSQADPKYCDGQRISIDQALKTITIFPAYQCFLDHKIGSLAVGKLADLVILDQNPRRVDPQRIGQIEVLETYLQGVPQAWK
jgi:predicted amidohydrolase YtcJ